MLIIYTYAAYLILSLGITIWVARTLHTNGRVFLVQSFFGDEAMADSVNRLLVVGFYLVNIGYFTMTMKAARKPQDLQDAVEFLSTKVGWVLLVLGAMHFLNMYVFHCFRRRGME